MHHHPLFLFVSLTLALEKRREKKGLRVGLA
jgi:hypothetical protein